MPRSSAAAPGALIARSPHAGHPKNTDLPDRHHGAARENSIGPVSDLGARGATGGPVG